MFQSRKETKRARLLTAASKVFARKRYSETSIKDITDAAGISVGSFYSYFENKEDIVASLYDAMTAMSIEAASAAAQGMSRGVARRFAYALASVVSVYLQHADLSTIVMHACIGINISLESRRRATFDTTIDYIKGVLNHMASEHAVIIDNTEVIAITISCSIYGLVSQWLEGKLSSPIQEATYALCAYHLRAIKVKFVEGDLRQVISNVLHEPD
jgi:AcrR family transcriptional regulator